MWILHISDSCILWKAWVVDICTVCVHLFTLRWHHNGLDSISNHQPHHCLLNRLYGRRSMKTSKLRVTGLCAGNSPGTGEFPAQMASNTKNVSIWWRLHGEGNFNHSSMCEVWWTVPHFHHVFLFHSRITFFTKACLSWIYYPGCQFRCVVSCSCLISKTDQVASGSLGGSRNGNGGDKIE